MMSLRRILMYSRGFATVPPIVPQSPSLHMTKVKRDSLKTTNKITKAVGLESPTKEVQGSEDGGTRAERSAKHVYEIIPTDRTNLWDQLCEMMKSQKFTTQDRGTVALLKEMDNVLTLFLVRKSDNLLLGFNMFVETETVVYGSVFLMRNGYRDSGWGIQLTKTFQGIMNESLKRKSLICRAGTVNIRVNFSMNYNFSFTTAFGKLDLTPRQFQQLIDYDKMVTGLDRTTFLQNYYSLEFVDGVVLYDTKQKIRGMAGLVPTLEENLYKLNPIYAENEEDAATLVHAVTARTDDSRAKFVCHVRADSAGDWIIKKCKDENIKLDRVGTLVYAMNTNQPYRDPSRTEFIFAPTNSPAHFDG